MTGEARPGPWRRLSISLRLALWSTAGLTAVLVIVGVAMTVGLRSGLRDRAHESLEVPFRVVAHQLEVQPDASLRDLLSEPPPRGESSSEVIGQILDRQGAVVESTGQRAVAQPVVSRPVLAEAARVGQWHEPRHLAGRSGEDMVVVVPVRKGAHAGRYVVLAQTLDATEHEVDRLRLYFLVLGPVVVLASLLGGWWIGRTALRSVDRLTSQAALIDPEVSDTILPDPGGDDEVSRLAQSLNAMLDRLRHEIDRQRRFSADASHELRTPLALMSTSIDVALRSPSTPEEARPLLDSLREDAARLGRIVDDLLVLSRADAMGRVALAPSAVDLLDLTAAVAARLAPAAEARGMRIEVAGMPVVISADERLLGQAVANLVDNAVKFGRPDGVVTVDVAGGTHGRAVTVAVSDDGPGIAAEDLPHIFERFYRADRSRPVGGSGLGLSIVEAIVVAHGGTVAASSPEGGPTTFTISLPTDATSATGGPVADAGGMSDPGPGPDVRDPGRTVR